MQGYTAVECVKQSTTLDDCYQGLFKILTSQLYIYHRILNLYQFMSSLPCYSLQIYNHYATNSLNSDNSDLSKISFYHIHIDLSNSSGQFYFIVESQVQTALLNCSNNLRHHIQNMSYHFELLNHKVINKSIQFSINN